MGCRCEAKDARQPWLHMVEGDPFELITARGQGYNRLRARSWWPADETRQMTSKPYSL